MEVMKERPPYVTFETRAIERRTEGGGVTYADVDFALVTPIGSKDVHERVVSEWFKYMQQLEQMERWPKEWTAGYRESYRVWKETHTIPVSGFPIVNWPVASKAEVKILQAIHILTVEDMAAATEEALQRIGMGGRNLKQRAQDWLTAKKDTAPLVEQLSALRETNVALERRIEELERQLTHRPPPEQVPTAGARLPP